jgi:hypothetical protein
MRTMIEGYRNFPGDHCGSVAMRGLLHHYCGLELPEAVVFGLGSGLGCLFMAPQGGMPVVFGRTGTMESDLASALGVGYSEAPDPDDDHAWQAVREEVLAGRPTMLTGDILYLDYREFKVHFPSHRFVLLGFDDDAREAYIADRIREEPEACSYAALRTSRNPPEGISTVNLWGRFETTRVKHDPTEASRVALRRCARRMLGEDTDDAGAALQGARGPMVSGVAGIRALARSLPGWAARPDAAEVARYNAGVIEKFGNGGGNFRRMYARYLEWARRLDPERVPEEAPSLAVRAADGWTALAGLLSATVSGEDVWAEAARRAGSIADCEERLFEGLARVAD